MKIQKQITLVSEHEGGQYIINGAAALQELETIRREKKPVFGGAFGIPDTQNGLRVFWHILGQEGMLAPVSLSPDGKAPGISSWHVIANEPALENLYQSLQAALSEGYVTDTALSVYKASYPCRVVSKQQLAVVLGGNVLLAADILEGIDALQAGKHRWAEPDLVLESFAAEGFVEKELAAGTAQPYIEYRIRRYGDIKELERVLKERMEGLCR